MNDCNTQVVTAMYVRHKTIEASKTLVEEVKSSYVRCDDGVLGRLDGGHDEGGLLNHSEEPALDDLRFSNSGASQAGKHDGPDRLP